MLGDALASIRRHFDLWSMITLRREIGCALRQIQVDFGGGSPLGKAFMMADLIRRYDLRTTVDIGVYRGRSFFPQALAHRRFTGGIAYGIDPWCASQAQEYATPELIEPIRQFVNKTNFQEIYEQVQTLVQRLHVQDHCVLLRSTSADAVSFFQNNNVYFDLLHIDGNHDTEKVISDVWLYAPRVKKHGFVILDDVSWKSVKPAFEKLTAKMHLLFHGKDPKHDYAVFWNGASGIGAETRRFVVKWMGASHQQIAPLC